MNPKNTHDIDKVVALGMSDRMGNYCIGTSKRSFRQVLRAHAKHRVDGAHKLYVSCIVNNPKVFTQDFS